jgi:transforming growth factor-beta-induced protein
MTATPITMPATKDIVETAMAAGTFKTLAAALQVAGLVETLKGAGPFTVFAPTDEAFARLPKGTVEALLQDKVRLSGILTYHVAQGRLLAQDVSKLPSAKTVNGQDVKISAANGSVKLNSATVVKADILASNGVIHVIDSVLMPS